MESALASAVDPAVLKRDVGDDIFIRAHRELYVTPRSHYHDKSARHMDALILQRTSLHVIEHDGARWWSRWALTEVPGRTAHSLQGHHTSCQIRRPIAIAPRTLFAPAVLGLSLPPEQTCMSGAQWSLTRSSQYASSIPIRCLLKASRADMHWLAILAMPFCSSFVWMFHLQAVKPFYGMVARGTWSQVVHPISADVPRHRTLPVCVDYHQIAHCSTGCCSIEEKDIRPTPTIAFAFAPPPCFVLPSSFSSPPLGRSLQPTPLSCIPAGEETISYRMEQRRRRV